MPWNEVTKMSLKEEFVLQALKEGSNISGLCDKFNISRKTGYKLLNRYKAYGRAGLEEQSRCHLSHPLATSEAMEKLIVEERKLHPCWGARKLKKVLENKGIEDVPSKSSINRVLEKNRLLRSQEEVRTTPWNFFEHPQPNALWQMDFKGYFPIQQKKCYPLTILDDHSRFSVTLKAFDNMKGITVKTGLIEAFRRYGLPYQINVDNGTPWGNSSGKGYTEIEVWLMRLGIKLSHSRMFHPQTNGKDERFHRTLKAEVLQNQEFKDFNEIQNAFDKWRHIYNTKRPHQGINMETPISRYEMSKRKYYEKLPEIEYHTDDIVKKVNSSGYVSLNNARYFISEALANEPVALRPTMVEGVYEVFYCAQQLKVIDPQIAVL